MFDIGLLASSADEARIGAGGITAVSDSRSRRRACGFDDAAAFQHLDVAADWWTATRSGSAASVSRLRTCLVVLSRSFRRECRSAIIIALRVGHSHLQNYCQTECGARE